MARKRKARNPLWCTGCIGRQGYIKAVEHKAAHLREVSKDYSDMLDKMAESKRRPGDAIEIGTGYSKDHVPGKYCFIFIEDAGW